MVSEVGNASVTVLSDLTHPLRLEENMFLDFLTSSYLQYKADTNILASWLAATAKKCGYASDLLQRENASQKQSSQRLKGRARKQARETAQNSQEDTKPTPSQSAAAPTYTIAIRDFISLAEYIASFTRPPVRVPQNVVASIDR